MDNSTSWNDTKKFYADNIDFFVEWRKNDTSREKLQHCLIMAGVLVSLCGIFGKKHLIISNIFLV
jgi:hypothetical protein